MTEASGGGRAEVERRLVERSLEDDAFRQGLLEDPRAAVQEELGIQLSAEVQVRVVEETADTIYPVLPSASAAGEAGELSDEELEAAAMWRLRACLPKAPRAVEDARHVRLSTRPSAHLPGRGHTQAGSTENERGSA